MNTPAILSNLPTDPKTGLTLPLSKSLASQDLAKHRAMIALELEVLAKKLDRFGWERDRNSPAHDRIVTDWMDALQDFPLAEVRAACAAHVLAKPGKMPNEGHVRAQIRAARARVVASLPKQEQTEQYRAIVSKARAAAILAEAGFAPRRMGDA